jgi:transcriptional regulator with XRE-family HTH domain
MPRPTSHRHVLRDLRNELKRTQGQFANLLGVSRVYINKIENGQIKEISPSLASRVHIATGINIDELAKGSEGKLIDHLGRPYSAETFVWWQKKLRQPSEADVIPLARNLRWWTWILLRAAVTHHGGVGYNAVIAKLIQSLDSIRRDFGLIETTDRMLRECTPPVKWLPGGRTPSELRQIDRELEKELAQAEAKPPWHRGVHWQVMKPPLKQPSTKKRRP